MSGNENLAAEIQDTFCVLWTPEDAYTLQPKVDDPSDTTFNNATADWETFRPKLIILHTGFMCLKVLEGCTNDLVMVLILLHVLKGSDNFADFPLFQEVAHALEPSLLLLRLLYSHSGRSHEFPCGMRPVHNFHDTHVF